MYLQIAAEEYAQALKQGLKAAKECSATKKISSDSKEINK